MALARMFPPGDGRHNSIKVNGRGYSVSPGSFVDVPTDDAHQMSANGWTRAGGGTCTVGPTSARPLTRAGNQPLAQDQAYIDTTLGAVITWDLSAKVWRNVITGAAV